MEGVYINGAPQGITFHETDEFTLYPASIISVNKNRFTKHYFIGSKRIASRIGSGHFNNVYGMNGCNITAGQQDYAERLNQIESQKEDYYRELGIAPGVPTMKGSYGDPENTGVGYNTIIRNLGDHSVPAEWVEYVKKNEQKETAPGAPIAWEKPSQPEEVQPGYGYVADNNATEETFYYHSDHLGSTSYITDDSARITQYTAYLPYGELLVDEHTSSEDLPYKFNGKELDEETGLYYYGARYMQPITSVWYGIDPLTEKYPDVSAYTYCMGNPVRLVDDDGKKVYLFATKLPMDNINLFVKSILSLATHTFIVVTYEGKLIKYAAYGPENGNSLGGDRLKEYHYQQDINVYKDYFKSKKNDNLKQVYEIQIPEGSNLDEKGFNDKVIDVINSFGNNKEMMYDILPNADNTGNCNTSSSTILLKSGVSKEEMQKIEESIPGINTGFHTENPSPWTKTEQKEAVERAKKREQDKLKESQTTIYIP